MAGQGAKVEPFAGLRVLDFTMVLSGPSCTRIFADMGAEVIKVEPPVGDRIRYSVPRRGEHSATFAQLNAGKKSLCIDLKKPEGREVIYRLAGTADVLVENIRPQAMAGLGLDYPALSAINPRLIYCSISGFGQTGPFANRLAYAPIIHATVGFDRAQMRDPKGLVDPPRGTGVLVADFVGGLTAFTAIQVALYHRERTGEGQFIDAALYDGMLHVMGCDIQDGQFPELAGPRIDYPPLKTRDGWITIVPTGQSQFENLARLVGHPEWIDDPRFGPYAARMRNSRELMALLADWTIQFDSVPLEQMLTDHSVPSAIFNRMTDFIDHPQAVHRESFPEVADGAGPIRVGATPFRFSSIGGRPKPFVSALGEFNHEILREAGYSAAEIAALEKDEVIQRPAEAPAYHRG